MKKNTVKKLKCEIFPVIITFFLGMSAEDIHSYLESNTEHSATVIRLLNLTTPAYTLSMVNHGEIFVNINEDYLDNPGYIAHECFHATEYTMEYVGIKHGEKSSECFAYFLTYLINALYEKV